MSVEPMDMYVVVKRLERLKAFRDAYREFYDMAASILPDEVSKQKDMQDLMQDFFLKSEGMDQAIKIMEGTEDE